MRRKRERVKGEVRRNSSHRHRNRRCDLHAAAYRAFEEEPPGNPEPLFPLIPGPHPEEVPAALLTSPDDRAMPGHRLTVSVPVYNVFPPHQDRLQWPQSRRSRSTSLRGIITRSIARQTAYGYFFSSAPTPEKMYSTPRCLQFLQTLMPATTPSRTPHRSQEVALSQPP